MNDSPTKPAITVDIVVYPGFKAMEAIGPMSVFEYANLHLQRRGKGPGYDVRVASHQPGPVRSDTLMCLEATKALSTLALPDDAIIVGSRHINAALLENPAIIDWVSAVAPKINRLAALCSGAFFLAQAGLLDRKHATTHWSVAAQLQQDFPAVQVDADAILSAAAISGPPPVSPPVLIWRLHSLKPIAAMRWRWRSFRASKSSRRM